MMKKNRLFILLVVICIGLFVPKDVFALQVYNNVNIDYRFFVDEDNAGDLKFRLYDKSGTLNFESKYDPSTKQYYFEYDENSFEITKNTVRGVTYSWWVPIASDYEYDTDYRDYVPYHDFLSNENNTVYGDFSVTMTNFFEENKLHGIIGVESWSFYSYIPLVLTEDSNPNVKKIIFASINVRNSVSKSSHFVQLYLLNNTMSRYNDEIALAESFLDNVDFMRKTTLDYSDELWEELNNGPIASNEIYSNNIASTNYKYVNQSIVTGERNVPEETLNDYAQSLPVLSFKKNDIDNNTNIVNAITNPKTFNNGVGLLIISLLLIIGLSVFLIKKNKKKLRINS